MADIHHTNPLKVKCIAVDDEPFALKLIADDIGKIPFLELITTCSSAAEAVGVLEKNKIDLIFLDIHMPGLTGTQLLRTLQNAPMVIMTTAYEQYALEGFELNVIDYLIKPIAFDRFLAAVNKVLYQFKLQHGLIPLSVTSPEDAFFFVHSEYKEIKIFFRDLLYVEGFKDYVKIFTTTQVPPLLTRLNLKAVESKLPVNGFCRIHNSFIVAFDKIESFQKSQVFIRQKAIPIGEKYAADFRQKYTAAH